MQCSVRFPQETPLTSKVAGPMPQERRDPEGLKSRGRSRPLVSSSSYAFCTGPQCQCRVYCAEYYPSSSASFTNLSITPPLPSILDGICIGICLYVSRKTWIRSRALMQQVKMMDRELEEHGCCRQNTNLEGLLLLAISSRVYSLGCTDCS
jgi:hypothetical protein